MSNEFKVEAPNETADPDGFHRAENVTVDHTHFNILKVVQQAKQTFTTKFAGRVPKHFYAPEAMLYLIDKAIKDMAENAGAPIPEGSFITNVYNMELHPAEGTCVTVTEEPIETPQSEPKLGFVVPGLVGRA